MFILLTLHSPLQLRVQFEASLVLQTLLSPLQQQECKFHTHSCYLFVEQMPGLAPFHTPLWLPVVEKKLVPMLCVSLAALTITPRTHINDLGAYAMKIPGNTLPHGFLYLQVVLPPLFPGLKTLQPLTHSKSISRLKSVQFGTHTLFCRVS